MHTILYLCVNIEYVISCIYIFVYSRVFFLVSVCRHFIPPSIKCLFFSFPPMFFSHEVIGAVFLVHSSELLIYLWQNVSMLIS